MDSGRQRQKLIIFNARGTLFVKGYQRKSSKLFGRGLEVHEVMNLRGRKQISQYKNNGYKQHESVINGGRRTCQLLKELHAQGHCIVVATEDLDTTPYQTALLDNGLSFIDIYNWKNFASDANAQFEDRNGAIVTDKEAKIAQAQHNNNKFKFYSSINKKFGRNIPIPYEDTILFDHSFFLSNGEHALDECYLQNNLIEVNRQRPGRLRSTLAKLSRPTAWSWAIGGIIIGFIVGAILTYFFGPVIGIKTGLGIKSAFLSFTATSTVLGGFLGNEIGKASNYCKPAPAPVRDPIRASASGQTQATSPPTLSHSNTLSALQIKPNSIDSGLKGIVIDDDYDDHELSRDASPSIGSGNRNASPRESGRSASIAGSHSSQSPPAALSFNTISIMGDLSDHSRKLERVANKEKEVRTRSLSSDETRDKVAPGRPTRDEPSSYSESFHDDGESLKLSVSFSPDRTTGESAIYNAVLTEEATRRESILSQNPSSPSPKGISFIAGTPFSKSLAAKTQQEMAQKETQRKKDRDTERRKQERRQSQTLRLFGNPNIGKSSDPVSIIRSNRRLTGSPNKYGSL